MCVPHSCRSSCPGARELGVCVCIEPEREREKRELLSPLFSFTRETPRLPPPPSQPLLFLDTMPTATAKPTTPQQPHASTDSPPPAAIAALQSAAVLRKQR